MKQKEESEFGKYIKQRMVERGFSSLTQLAKESGISRPTLYALLDGSTGEARISTVLSLATVLYVHPVVLFRYLLAELDFSHFTTTGAKYRCDGTGFIQDVSIPDNTMVLSGSMFIKTWEIQNVGTMNWVGRKLVCIDNLPLYQHIMPANIAPFGVGHGLIPAQRELEIPRTLPGEHVLLSVAFKAPSYPGTMVSYWKMVDEYNDFCFPNSQGLSCLVRVVSI